MLRIVSHLQDGTVMTMILKPVEPGHHLRSKEDDLAVATDKDGV